MVVVEASLGSTGTADATGRSDATEGGTTGQGFPALAVVRLVGAEASVGSTGTAKAADGTDATKASATEGKPQQPRQSAQWTAWWSPTLRVVPTPPKGQTQGAPALAVDCPVVAEAAPQVQLERSPPPEQTQQTRETAL